MNCLGGGCLSLPSLCEALRVHRAVHKNGPHKASEWIHLPSIAQISPRFWPVLNLLTGRESLAGFQHSHGVAFHKAGLLKKASHHKSLRPCPRKSGQGLREPQAWCGQESLCCLQTASRRGRVLCFAPWPRVVRGWGGIRRHTASSFILTCIFSSEELSEGSTIQLVI